jgi:lysophospholipase L1-like esterase
MSRLSRWRRWPLGACLVLQVLGMTLRAGVICARPHRPVEATPTAATTIVFYGDSIANGKQASSCVGGFNSADPSSYVVETAAAVASGTCWANLVAAHYGAPSVNLSIGRSPLEMCGTPVNCPTLAGSDPRRLAQLARYMGPHAFLYIAFGANDVGIRDASFTAENYKAALNRVIDAAVTGGTPLSHIRVLSTPYLAGAGAQALSVTFGLETARVAVDRGIGFIDVWTPIASAVASEGLANVLCDSLIHPCTAGHAVMAAAIENATPRDAARGVRTFAALRLQLSPGP